MKEESYRHSLGGGDGDAAVAADAGGFETAPAAVRQADGLLSALCAHAGGDAGDSSDFDPAGSASF